MCGVLRPIQYISQREDKQSQWGGDYTVGENDLQAEMEKDDIYDKEREVGGGGGGERREKGGREGERVHCSQTTEVRPPPRSAHTESCVAETVWALAYPPPPPSPTSEYGWGPGLAPHTDSVE